MKDTISTVLCCIMFLHIQAQNHSDNLQKVNAEWKTFPATERTKATQLSKNKTNLQLGADDELILQTTHDDQLGFRHYRYRQHYKGIPVEGAIYLMHEKDNKVEIANGNLVRQLDINTRPTIDEATALQAALQHVNATQYAWQDPGHERFIKQSQNNPDATFYPSGKLIIVKPANSQEQSEYKLTYKFNIYTLKPLSGKDIYINAHDGSFVNSIENIHTCTDVPASGTSNYSGDIDFTACQDGGTHILKNNIGGGRQIFNANNDNSLLKIPFTDNDTSFDDDPTANEVHWATEKTYQYFLDTFDRNSLDSSGMPIHSWVHYGNNYNNAFWNPSLSVVCYGDGDNIKFTSLTAPDIVAHEMTHGVTTFSANLIYYNESGALNESFSDIFGEVAENYMRGTNDWLMGGDFTVQTGKTTLRNMSYPNDPNAITQQPDTYLGNFWYSGSGDNGGVHYNSGVQNYWFYLLSEGGSGTNDNGDAYTVNPIGMAKAAAIAYRNLTVYLTPTSQYSDARTGAIQAATDLYGADSDEVLQTQAAWCAVGVGTCTLPMNCRADDYIALRALYLNTDGDNWTDNTGWLTAADFNANPTIPNGTDMSTWYGIQVDGNDCVSCIDMDGIFNCGGQSDNPGNNLFGNIPAEIGNLRGLTFLRLTNNQLSSIPPELGNLSNLTYLSLDHNQLSGSIPPELGNLNSLTFLRLNNNQLSGSIPSEFGNLSNLTYTYLYNNFLSGAIPPELGSLSNLATLNLYNNQLSGNIPPELGDLSSLTYITLFNNQLSGCYGSNLMSLCTQLLPLYNNNANISNGNNLDATWENFCNSSAGTCPANNCRYTDSLALVALYDSTNGANWTNVWDLSQPMDIWHGVTLNGSGCVQYLHLDNNQLNGSIPTELGSLAYLRDLYLGRNNLSGNIPSEFGGLDSLRDLRMELNQLNGNIPPELGNLNLEIIHLPWNDLSGGIPPELGNLTDLIMLDLYSNNLSGNIPPELGNLNNLIYCGLSQNNLSGCYDSNLMSLCSVNDTNISSGNNFDAPWEDFCNNGAGICNDNDPVWPGDFNANGIASNIDVLYWGLALGNTGPLRPNASTDWIAQNAAQWQQEIDNINGKHQDGNGDGIVDIQDLQVLIDNYGLTHTNNFPIDTEIPLQLEMILLGKTSANGETTSTYGLYVTSSSGAPVNSHGLALSVDLSEVPFFQEYSIDTIGSSLQPDATLDVYNTTTGVLDIAFTRTDKISKVINGAVLAQFIVIASDLPTGDTHEINLYGGSVMSATGLLNALGDATIYSSLSGQYSGIADFSVSINVSHEQCNQLGKASVQAFDGTAPYTYLWSTGATTAEATELDSGLYTVTVTDADGNSKSTTIQVNGSIPIYDTNGNLLCGSTCPDFLAPENGISDGLYKADNKLESSGIVPAGSTVDFKAGQTIELKKGFTIQSNADFSAEIEDCDPQN